MIMSSKIYILRYIGKNRERAAILRARARAAIARIAPIFGGKGRRSRCRVHIKSINIMVIMIIYDTTLCKVGLCLLYIMPQHYVYFT